MSKDDLIRGIEAEAIKLPGNKVGFSQPIEMRFNELIAGVREDLGVKVFAHLFFVLLLATKLDTLCMILAAAIASLTLSSVGLAALI